MSSLDLIDPYGQPGAPARKRAAEGESLRFVYSYRRAMDVLDAALPKSTP